MAANAKCLPAVLQFDLFELDSESALLRRSGVPVDLPPQALRILVMLAARPNELVRRTEIKQTLWPGESHGDFDSRLNFAVKKLREALCDSADQPRYVQTVRNAGYIFIAPLICRHTESDRKGGVSVLSQTELQLKAEIKGSEQSAFRVSAGTVLIVVAVVVSSAFAFTGFLLRHRTASPLVQLHQESPRGLSNLDGADGVPQISSISPIAPQARQTIVIRGRGFGLQVPYSRSDSPYLAIRDQTANWAAGRIIPENWDEVMVDVQRWTNNEIVLRGFSGDYGRNGWKLLEGDIVEAAVWNPQTGTGPATFEVSVTSKRNSR